MSLAADDRGVVDACPACRQANRLPFDALGRPAKCGRCGQELLAPGVPVEIPSEASFEALVSRSPIPVVVDWWAPWCGPCRMVAPEMEKVAAARRGRWLVAKVNTEDLPELGARAGVQAVPTLAVYAGGRERARDAGARPAAQIEQFVEEALAAPG